MHRNGAGHIAGLQDLQAVHEPERYLAGGEVAPENVALTIVV
jgi:hypothetical protein